MPDDSLPWQDFEEEALNPEKLTYYYPETEEATLAAGLDPRMEGGVYGAGDFSGLDLRDHTLERYNDGDPNSVVAVAMPGRPTGARFPLNIRGRKVRAWNVDTGGGLEPGQIDVASSDPEMARSGQPSIDLYPEQPPWEDFAGQSSSDRMPWEDFAGEQSVSKALPTGGISPPSPATTIPNLPEEENRLVSQIEKNRIAAAERGVFPKAQGATAADKPYWKWPVPEQPPKTYLAQTANYLRHAHWANNDEYREQLDATLPTGRGITEPLYQPKQLKAGQDVPDLDPLTMKPNGKIHKATAFEAAAHNTVNGVLSGATSAQGLLEMLPPVFLAETIYSLPSLYRRWKEVDQTPAWSQERWEFGLQVAGTLATLGLMGDASLKSLLKGAPTEVTDKLGGDPNAERIREDAEQVRKGREEGKPPVQSRAEESRPDIQREAQEAPGRPEELEEPPTSELVESDLAAEQIEEPSAEEQARMQQEYENELLAEAEEYMSRGGDEYMSALKKFGGLPLDASKHAEPLRGELNALREEFTKKAPGRKGRTFFGKSASGHGYDEVFTKHAGSTDVLAQNMKEAGFDVETGDDVVELTRQRLRSTRPIYGMEARGQALEDPLDAARAEMLGSDEALRASAMNKASALEPSSAGSLGVTPFDPFGKDLGKLIGNVTSTFAKAAKQVRALFSPVNASPEAAEMGRMIRASEGERNRQAEIAVTAVKKLMKLMFRLNNRTNLDFIDKMEKGLTIDPRFQSYLPTRNKAYSDRISMIRSLDENAMQHLLEYYFPHIWTKESIERVSKGNVPASNAWAAIFGKRPLTGPKGFLKKRTIPDTMTGVALGLEPVTFNPIELDLLKLREMDRYIAGKKLWQEVKDRGLPKFVRVGAKAPFGYTEVNDPLARVLAPKDWTIIDAQGRKMPGQKVLGHYYLPDDIARVLNNHLSAGLRGVAVYDALRLVGNTMNQVQLGISLYHATFTAIDATASTGALGIEQIARSGGSPKEIAIGAFNIARSIAQAPVGGGFIENIWRGSQFLKEYSKPGSTNARMGKIVDAAVKANVPIRMDSYYGTGAAESFVNAMRKGNYGGALLRLPFAALDASAKPLMEFAVPRIKMGITAQRIAYELSKLPIDASEDAVRKVVGRVVDSTDNRMGQMKYDNVFWHKTLKDLLMLSVRSVGWNLGDIRELGGGALDFITAPSRMYKNITAPEVGANPVMTTRMAYLIYYPFIVGSLGAIYQYLKTGEGPKSLEDYYMPRTGRMNPDGSPERVMLPTYMKDIAPLAVAGARHGVIGFTSRLGKSAQNKIHPLFSMLSQMMQNKDFYGTEIRNENDNLVQSVKKEAAFVFKQFRPFSVTGFIRREGGPVEKAEAVAGIMPASQELTMSRAEETAHKYFLAQLPQGARTQEAADTSKLKSDVLRKVRKGDYSDLQKAVSSGKLSQRSALSLAQRAQLKPLEYQVKRLTPEQGMDVWRVASKEERALIGSILRAKVERSKTLSRDKMIGFLNELSQ